MVTTSKIKIELDEAAHSLLSWTLAGLREPGGIIRALEVECLVLMHFESQNLKKLVLGQPPVKIALHPHEALSLKRLLLRIDLQDPIGDIARNYICDSVQKALPGLG